jgi:vacuolar fusion protein MON1
VNAYIEFLGREDSKSGSSGEETVCQGGGSNGDLGPAPDPGIALVCISGGGDFESIRLWSTAITEVIFVSSSRCSLPHMALSSAQRLGSEGTLTALAQAVRAGSTTYSVSELSIPGLRHFVYKSRAHVQVTLPTWEDPYDDLDERRRCARYNSCGNVKLIERDRLMTLYQILYDAIHGKSGQAETLKLQYIRTEKESVLGWVRGHLFLFTVDSY